MTTQAGNTESQGMPASASAAADHFRRLAANPYPGRGIVLGATPDGKTLVQVYWIMGRSENSRNRIFVREDGQVRTRAFDESRMTDPSLVIYYPVRHVGNYHIVTNGDQTDTIRDFLSRGKFFEEALQTRTFEPDGPNFTPRISGLTDVGGEVRHRLSILRARDAEGRYCDRAYFHYAMPTPGLGHCIHTYAGDGRPLPKFRGEPYPVPLPADMDETAKIYWDALDRDNRVALLVKHIDGQTGDFRLRIINRLG